jgi:hypothetical protein
MRGVFRHISPDVIWRRTAWALARRQAVKMLEEVALCYTQSTGEGVQHVAKRLLAEAIGKSRQRLGFCVVIGFDCVLFCLLMGMRSLSRPK